MPLAAQTDTPFLEAVTRPPGRRWKRRVLRGGSWNNNGRNCRAANRNSNEPGNRNNNIGFRVLLFAGASTPRAKRRLPWPGPSDSRIAGRAVGSPHRRPAPVPFTEGPAEE
jgi:hypothetical protein